MGQWKAIPPVLTGATRSTRLSWWRAGTVLHEASESFLSYLCFTSWGQQAPRSLTISLCWCIPTSPRKFRSPKTSWNILHTEQLFRDPLLPVWLSIIWSVTSPVTMNSPLQLFLRSCFPPISSATRFTLRTPKGIGWWVFLLVQPRRGQLWASNLSSEHGASLSPICGQYTYIWHHLLCQEARINASFCLLLGVLCTEEDRATSTQNEMVGLALSSWWGPGQWLHTSL